MPTEKVVPIKAPATEVRDIPFNVAMQDADNIKSQDLACLAREIDIVDADGGIAATIKSGNLHIEILNHKTGALHLPDKDLQAHLDERKERMQASSGGSTPQLEALLLTNPTEDSIAQVFESRLEGRLIHVTGGREGWYMWNGTAWEYDGNKNVLHAARKLAREGRPGGKGVAHTKASFAAGVCKFAAASPAFSRKHTDLDSNRWLLNTPDGVYDLKECIFREHAPDDLMTQITGTGPGVGTGTNVEGGNRFEQFMEEITCGDGELYRYIQRFLGSALSGGLEEHVMGFGIGDGRNGKNVLMDTVRRVMGSYARVIPESTLISLYDSHKHPADRANLLGARLAICSEIPEGSYWDENAIKMLTGDETISGRFMRQDFFEIKRTWRMMVIANNAPQLRTADKAIRARLKIIPFNASFRGREDRRLMEKLWKESEYILQWLMKGHQMWMENDMDSGTSAAMDAEEMDYHEGQGTIASWLDDHCGNELLNPEEEWTSGKLLYMDYKSWKETRMERPVTMTRWGTAMKRQYAIPTKRTNKGVVYAVTFARGVL